jgi:ADP-ribosylglycohydrolase
VNEIRRRARNALHGLAVGDALGWPALFHRSRLLPAWPRRLRREIETASETTGVLRIPMPFSLNQPAEVFELCPTDDTEWAAWTMDAILAGAASSQERMPVQGTLQSWLALAQSGENVLGWVSTRAALANLGRGILPPASGHDNPHYFDDGALCRAVPIGILFAGDPDGAAQAAEIEASITNSEDGIWTAQAIAAAMSVACAGGNAQATIQAALRLLPPESWARRVTDEALAICAFNGKASPNREESIGGMKSRFFSLVPQLHDILNKEYSYGSVGPETLALTLAIVTEFREDFQEAVMAAASFAKGADSVPAIVGALCGALSPTDPVPPEWLGSVDRLKGICLPSFKGKSYLNEVERFVEKCSSIIGPRTHIS